MTKWIWPNFVNMTEIFTTTIVNILNLTEKIINIATRTNIFVWIWPKVEITIKIATTTNISVWIWPKINIAMIFGHIQLDMLVVVELFLIFLIFSQTHSFLVMFYKLTFVVFGQLQPNEVPRFRSNSTTAFGHLNSVMFISLNQNIKTSIRHLSKIFLSF